jgi:hypothetical protein
MPEMTPPPLEWVQNPLNPSGFAALPKDQTGHNYFCRVVPARGSLAGSWHYSRDRGLLIGPLDIGSIERVAPTADAAKAAADQD